MVHLQLHAAGPAQRGEDGGEPGPERPAQVDPADLGHHAGADVDDHPPRVGPQAPQRLDQVGALALPPVGGGDLVQADQAADPRIGPARPQPAGHGRGVESRELGAADLAQLPGGRPARIGEDRRLAHRAGIPGHPAAPVVDGPGRVGRAVEHLEPGLGRGRSGDGQDAQQRTGEQIASPHDAHRFSGAARDRGSEERSTPILAHPCEITASSPRSSDAPAGHARGAVSASWRGPARGRRSPRRGPAGRAGSGRRPPRC